MPKGAAHAMSNEDNPYAPPPLPKEEVRQFEPDYHEGPLFRVIGAFIAVCILALLLTADFRRLNLGVLAVIAMWAYGSFVFGHLAVTGRWFSFKSWFH